MYILIPKINVGDNNIRECGPAFAESESILLIAKTLRYTVTTHAFKTQHATLLSRC